MPAPDGPNTLVQALLHLNAANIDLLDIALRRPSLEEVFLALTTDTIGDTSATRPGQHVAAGSGRPAGGRHRRVQTVERPALTRKRSRDRYRGCPADDIHRSAVVGADCSRYHAHAAQWGVAHPGRRVDHVHRRFLHPAQTAHGPSPRA